MLGSYASTLIIQKSKLAQKPDFGSYLSLAHFGSLFTNWLTLALFGSLFLKFGSGELWNFHPTWLTKIQLNLNTEIQKAINTPPSWWSPKVSGGGIWCEDNGINIYNISTMTPSNVLVDLR